MDYDTLVAKVKHQERIILSMQWGFVFLIIAVITILTLMMWQSVTIIGPIIDNINMLAENDLRLLQILTNSGICEVAP